MRDGQLGRNYLIGGDMELSNLELAKRIHAIFNARCPDQARDFDNVFEFVSDRKGHDQRYAVNTARLKAKFPNIASIDFDASLGQTVDFYLRR